MEKKILGVLFCTLLTFAAVSSVVESTNIGRTHALRGDILLKNNGEEDGAAVNEKLTQEPSRNYASDFDRVIRITEEIQGVVGNPSLESLTQPPYWAKAYHAFDITGAPRTDIGRCVRQTADGFIVVGRSWLPPTAATNIDIEIFKLDNNGDVMWEDRLDIDGGANQFCRSIEIVPGSPQEYILAGWGVIPGVNGHNILIARLDNNGIIQWDRAYRLGSGGDYALSIKRTPTNNYIIAGQTTNTPNGVDILVMRINGNGDIIWPVKIYDITGPALGDRPLSVDAFTNYNTGQEEYVLTGIIGPGVPDAIFVMRLDNNLDPIWTRRYDIPGQDDYAYHIKRTPDNGFILIGYTNEGGIDCDILVMKLYDNGMIDWGYTYHGIPDNWDEGYSIDYIALPQPEFILTGSTASQYTPPNDDLLIVRLSSDGTIDWAKTLSPVAPYPSMSGSECGYSIEIIGPLIPPSECIVAGYTTSFVSGLAWYDFLVAKVSSNGEIDPGRCFRPIRFNRSLPYICSCAPPVSVSIVKMTEPEFNFTVYTNYSVTVINEYEPGIPEIEITKPRDHLYINDKETIPTPFTIVIGGITVEAFDKTGGLTRVEFYIDRELRYTDYEEPYEWFWDERILGIHTIKATGYDIVGRAVSDEIDILIFNV